MSDIRIVDTMHERKAMMADLADAGTVPAVAGFATPAPAATRGGGRSLRVGCGQTVL